MFKRYFKCESYLLLFRYCVNLLLEYRVILSLVKYLLFFLCFKILTSLFIKQYNIDTIKPWNECNICAEYDQKANNSGLFECGSGIITNIKFVIPSKGTRAMAALDTFLVHKTKLTLIYRK